MGGEAAFRPVDSFIDDRGHVLRVSWHDDHAVAVFSIWRDGECIATTRVAGHDLVRLSTMLTQAWLDSEGRAPSR